MLIARPSSAVACYGGWKSKNLRFWMSTSLTIPDSDLPLFHTIQAAYGRENAHLTTVDNVAAIPAAYGRENLKASSILRLR